MHFCSQLCNYTHQVFCPIDESIISSVGSLTKDEAVLQTFENLENFQIKKKEEEDRREPKSVDLETPSSIYSKFIDLGESPPHIVSYSASLCPKQRL